MARRWALLGHPVWTGAVAVLAVNDAVLKSAWPGMVSGKLSDVAGVFVVAVLASVVLGSVGPGLALTAGGFMLLKLVPGVAEAAAPLLGGVTRRDPSDLVALVMVLPGALFVRQVGARDGRYVGRRVVPGALVALAWCSVVFVTTATSCLPNEGIEQFVIDEATLYARSDTAESPLWWRSDDGGLGWVRVRAADVSGSPSSTTSCVDRRCLRVDGRSVAEQVGDGPWTTAFSFTDTERASMEARSQGSACGPTVDGMFTAVVSVVRPTGRVDVVAMGTQGILRREGEGPWKRLAIGDDAPLPTAPVRTWVRWLYLAPLVLIGAGPVLAVVARRRRRTGAVVGAVLGGCAIAMAGVSWGIVAGADDTLPATVTLATSVFVLSLATWWSRRSDPAPRALPPPDAGTRIG